MNSAIAARTTFSRHVDSLATTNVRQPAPIMSGPRRASVGLDGVIGKVHYGAVSAGTVYGDRGGVIEIIGD